MSLDIQKILKEEIITCVSNSGKPIKQLAFETKEHETNFRRILSFEHNTKVQTLVRILEFFGKRVTVTIMDKV